MNILILTCNTGGGHNAVAAALTEAFRQRGADSRVLDGLSFVSRKASKFVSRWHTRFYRHYPQLYKAGYMSAEEEDGRPAPRHNPVETYLSRGARRLARYLQAERFDAVVCVHVIPALMMTMLRQNGGAPMPFCFVATDYTCSPTVGSCTPDICVIPHAELAEEFIHCGIAADTLLPAGIPTRSVFAAPTDRAAARQELSLPAEGRHILLMSGSIGCGPGPPAGRAAAGGRLRHRPVRQQPPDALRHPDALPAAGAGRGLHLPRGPVYGQRRPAGVQARRHQHHRGRLQGRPHAAGGSGGRL